MRYLFLLFLLSGLACTSVSESGARLLTDIKPAPEYDPPRPETWSMKNGIEVVFIEDNELPLIAATLYTRHGSLHVPEISPEVASVAGGQMRAGGAGKWSADQLDAELEKLAAGVSSSIGEEHADFSVAGLVSDREKLFEIFAAVIQEPHFDPARLSLWKGRAIESIARRKEDPFTVAKIAFNQVLYPEVVYGAVMTSAEVNNVSRADLLRVHRAIVKPEKAILTITGALTRQEAKKLIAKYFSNWNEPDGNFVEAPKVLEPQKAGVYLLEMPFEQTTIIMGQQGVKRLSPDHYAITVFNDIFGAGGFASRLAKKIRVELGLAYSTYGAITPGVDKGKNYIVIQTKADSTLQAVQAALLELSTLQEEQVTEAELLETKRSIEQSLIFRFGSPSALLSRYAVLDLLNYPEDYDRNYFDRIKKVSAKDVQNVARNLWDSDQFVTIIVGNKTACNSIRNAIKNGDLDLSKSHLYSAKFNEVMKVVK